MFAIVSECCPIRCANDVFLARSKKDGQIYSYCWACGAMWHHPLEARWEGPDAETLDPRNHLPEGFEFPSGPDIAEAGLSGFVIRKTKCEYCAKYFQIDLSGQQG